MSLSRRRTAAASGRSPLRSQQNDRPPTAGGRSLFSVPGGGNDPVAHRADALDLGLHHVPKVEDLRRRSPETDAVRRAGRDHCPWQGRHALGHPFDDGVDRIDHVPDVSVLLQLAIESQAYAQRLRILKLIAGHDPRARGTRAVQALALEVLAAPAVLDVARGDVVERGVPEDVAASTPALDVRAPLADDHGELGFPVDLVADRRVYRDVGEGLRQRGDGFGEDSRRLGLVALLPRRLLGVLLIVAPDRDDVAARLGEGGEKLHIGKAVSRCLRGGQRRARGGQSLLACVDQRLHVTGLGYLHHLVLVAHHPKTRTAGDPKRNQPHVSSFSFSSISVIGLAPAGGLAGAAPRNSSSKSARRSRSWGRPSSLVVPETSTLVQLAISSAARARCSTSSTALPTPASRLTCSRSRLSASLGLRFAVGSSRMSTFGSSISTRAIASILPSPPLSSSP